MVKLHLNVFDRCIHTPASCVDLLLPRWTLLEKNYWKLKSLLVVRHLLPCPVVVQVPFVVEISGYMTVRISKSWCFSSDVLRYRRQRQMHSDRGRKQYWGCWETRIYFSLLTSLVCILHFKWMAFTLDKEGGENTSNSSCSSSKEFNPHPINVLLRVSLSFPLSCSYLDRRL